MRKIITERMKFKFFISIRYLKSKKNYKYPSLSSVFTFLGVVISVATLIIVLSVMNGFVDELMKKILGVNSNISLSKFGYEKILNYKEIEERLKNINKISDVNSIVEGQGMILNSSTEKASGIITKGIIDKDLLKRKEIVENLVLHPDCENDIFKKENGILIGSYLANSIGVGIGDVVSIFTSVVDKSIIGTMPRYKDFFVCGTFETGASMYDNSMVFMSFEISQKLFKYKNSASSIEIFLNDINDLDYISDKIYKDNIWNENIIDWKKNNESLVNAMKIEKTVMSFILSLFLIVAVFGIFANSIMLVNEKSKSIAIMMSFGIEKRDIRDIFLFNSLIIGISGTIFGSLIGVLFAKNIESIRHFLEKFSGFTLLDGAVYFLSYLPSNISLSEVFYVVFFSIFIVVLASIFPALKASRIKISEAMRQI